MFIDRYEGRLLAFVENRLSNRSQAEDIVQEALIGFLNSLPNYDGQRPLESYLFSICAYKLTDHLRRLGRRPTLSIDRDSSEAGGGDRLAGRDRMASSLARSTERRSIEEESLANTLREQIDKWKKQEDWVKLMCLEMLLVGGRSNKDVAQQLDLTEQKVANYKSDFILRTKSLIRRLGLDAETFPELDI